MTAQRVMAHFRSWATGPVERFEVPNVQAIKLIVHGALGGGAPRSLRSDNLGKALASALLRMEIEVPDGLLSQAQGPQRPSTDVVWPADGEQLDRGHWRLRRDGFVVTLQLNRPEAMNALSRPVLEQLVELARAAGETPWLRTVVVAGTERAFSAGADLKERQGMSEPQVADFVSFISRTMTAVADIPVPVVAAIEGYCFGGGLELALAADIRVASRTAQLGLTEVSLGIIPGAGGTQRLPRIVGSARAAELIFAARRLSGEEAAAVGLVNRLVEPGQALAGALALAGEISRGAPLALRAAKQALVAAQQRPLGEGLEVEQRAYQIVLRSRDRLEGLAAFHERRPPVYRGE